MLTISKDYIDNWNYGNAIYLSNWTLGMVALEKRDINTAKEFLLKSGNTPGSPQLNSFGPNMRLAKRLLEQGEYDVVLQFLNQIKKFWKGAMHFTGLILLQFMSEKVPEQTSCWGSRLSENAPRMYCMVCDRGRLHRLH